jgi:hypothetical protein
MTVYVDDYRVQATVGRISARWSHLFVAPDGDIGELHALAARIGLRLSWFQAKGWPRDHYDVTDARRAAAIEAGAVPVTWAEAGRWRAAAIDAAKTARANAPEPPSTLPAEARRYPALTVHQPWAWALLHGKPVENRTWKLGYKGPLWLHAGKAWDEAGESSPLVRAAWDEHARRMAALSPKPTAEGMVLGPGSTLVRSGAVLAMLEVDGCHHADDCASGGARELCSPWAVRGQYHIEVRVLASLPSPVPCPGRQKLWALPREVEHAARAQIASAA